MKVGRDPKTSQCLSCRREQRWRGIINQNGAPFTLANYYLISQQQEGRCAGCRRHENDLAEALCVDHDHATGIVRGLLCKDCNYALGCVKDSAATLKRLAMYLKEIP